MTDLDLLFQPEADARTPEVYNLECPHTLAIFASYTPCFTKHSGRDEECVGCPLSTKCEAEKNRIKSEKAQTRASRKEALQNALGEGFDLSGVKVPRKVRLDLPNKATAMADTFCVATGTPIPDGTDAIHIEGWGWLDSQVYDYLTDLADL